MATFNKIYSTDTTIYTQSSVSKRIEALFLNNVGKIVTRAQILKAAKDPNTGVEPENWHQRMSELRTDKGYTILSSRDTTELATEEYLMPHTELRANAGRRVQPTKACWEAVCQRAGNRCEWTEDGQRCTLHEGENDHIGGGKVKLTPDHLKPHSIDPASDPHAPTEWQALCGRHQVMKKNFWDSSTGKINLPAIVQAASKPQKKEVLNQLLDYFGLEIKN
ncbi:hypothetical protein [Roseateles sp. PN1]|uniref:hypothetical protein n=1 Tax=Roseateles sp. PN1 TaxID=3137372 RepID=UPI003138C5A2